MARLHPPVPFSPLFGSLNRLVRGEKPVDLALSAMGISQDSEEYWSIWTVLTIWPLLSRLAWPLFHTASLWSSFSTSILRASNIPHPRVGVMYTSRSSISASFSSDESSFLLYFHSVPSSPVAAIFSSLPVRMYPSTSCLFRRVLVVPVPVPPVWEYRRDWLDSRGVVLCLNEPRLKIRK